MLLGKTILTGNISSPVAGFHRFAVTEGIVVLVVYDSSQASGSEQRFYYK